MKIEEFIKEFNDATDKEKAIRKHIVNDYIAFERKIAVCNLIAKKMVLENGDLIKNTPMVYENFIISLLGEYTDVEFVPDEALEVFNHLERNGVTEFLIAAVGRDAKTFNTVLDMTINDTVDNHNNLVNHLNIKADNMNFIFDKLTEMIQSLSQKSGK